MHEPPNQFQHKLSQAAKRDHQGLILIESTCLKCGSWMTVSITDGSLQDWETQHECAKLSLIRRQ
jgi:hypothetical protein